MMSSLMTCDTGLVCLRGCMSVSKVKASLVGSKLTRRKSKDPSLLPRLPTALAPTTLVLQFCACMKGAVQSASQINSTSCQLPPVWLVDATTNCWTRCQEPKHCTTQTELGLGENVLCVLLGFMVWRTCQFFQNYFCESFSKAYVLYKTEGCISRIWFC